MRNILFLMLFASTSAYSATEVNSSQIKKLVCKSLASNFDLEGVKASACIKDPMYFDKAPVKVKIEGEEKSISTIIFVKTTTSGMDFKASLKADLEVTDSGKIVRKGWLVLSTTAGERSVEKILELTWGHSTNVSEISDSDFSSDVLNNIEVAIYDTPTVDFADEDDFEIEDATYYAINNPKNDEVIGYLAEFWVGSENADMKADITFKFDLNGKKIDESIETLNYHE